MPIYNSEDVPRVTLGKHLCEKSVKPTTTVYGSVLPTKRTSVRAAEGLEAALGQPIQTMTASGDHLPHH